MKRTLFFHGPGDEGDFCDHPDVDDNIDCDDDSLWAIQEGTELVGFVCSPHKDAYKASIGIE